MKLKYLTLFLVIFIFLISACATQPATQPTQPVCNKPYILVGNDCCLDKDDNGICDKDESEKEIEEKPNVEIKKEEVKEVSDEEKLEQVAKRFGVLTNGNEYSDLYDILTPERRKSISKENFIKLYPLQYGENIYRSVILNKIDIEGEDVGFAYYDLVWANGYQETSGNYYFKKVDGEWYFDGFSSTVYFGCFDTSECYATWETLKTVCEQTCNEQLSLPLREEEGKEVSCKDYVCQCICWDEGTSSGNNIPPDAKFLH